MLRSENPSGLPLNHLALWHPLTSCSTLLDPLFGRFA